MSDEFATGTFDAAVIAGEPHTGAGRLDAAEVFGVGELSIDPRGCGPESDQEVSGE